ncbi:uncharacterized protein C3orf18-like [Toxotes jaculatrix]|uniref:uncharacterized protein C3orf18-like n=1 Tax=Toxotes jaculatrix TaxID=941984 RepID=UPI001B3ABD18|nr:uncharacterized protein C3orf18-like [Toxotes jaculatrix]
MEEEKEMHFNHTTPHISPLKPKPGFAAYYAFIPVALLILLGCVVALVYMRKKWRSDELRHRLIPLYSYDPSEDWRDSSREAEEEELVEPLYKEGKLAFSPGYGTKR